MEIANLNIEKALHGLEAIPFVDKKTNTVTSFQRVYDSVKLPDDPRIAHIKVAISFQVHSYGNFAVIRNAAEKPKTSERSDKDAIPAEQKELLTYSEHEVHGVPLKELLLRTDVDSLDTIINDYNEYLSSDKEGK